MTKLHVRMLGGWEIEAGASSIVVPSRKTRGLLAYLARTPGTHHSRESLAALLWPDSAERQARASVRQSLKILRKALKDHAPEAVQTVGDRVFLQANHLEVDVVTFEERLQYPDPESLEIAASLYRGGFLEGLNLTSNAFCDWVVIENARLRDKAIDCLSLLMRLYAESSRLDAAIQVGHRLLALDPLQENVHKCMIKLYISDGKRGLARSQFQACQDILERELGVQPDSETVSLLEAQAARREPASEPAMQAPGPAMDRSAVAVLPFAVLGEEQAQDYFRDGLCEEIITTLAGWRRFPLIASTSTLTICERSPRHASSAEILGARYLVDGAVRQSGEKLRVTARLVDGVTKRLHWAERFDFKRRDIFDVQEEAARKITAMLVPELERAEIERIRLKGTGAISAWDHWLRGLAHLRLCSTQSNTAARRCFVEALRIDEHYSDAFVGIAKSHSQDILFRSSAHRNRSVAQALEAARQAVALDPLSSDAHLVFAAANVWAGDITFAIPETETAIELNPSNAHARMALGNRLDLIGDTERGIEEMKRGLALNPRDPRRFSYMGFLARAYTSLGQNDKALDWAFKAVRVRPDHPDQHYRLAVCLANADRRPEAVAALQACEKLRPGFVNEQANWRPYSDEERNSVFFAGLNRLDRVK